MDEKEKSEKALKLSRYWINHPEEKRRFDELKAKLETAKEHFQHVEQDNADSKKRMEGITVQIANIDAKIDACNETIAKLEKKIFGKAKAKEEILLLVDERQNYEEEKNKQTEKLIVQQQIYENMLRELDAARRQLEQATEGFTTYQKSIEI